MGKTPKRYMPQYWNGDISWISIADMKQGKFLTGTRYKITQSALDEVFRGKIVKAGTLIMSFKLTIGRVCILGIDAVHHEGIISIYPNTDKVSRDYLFYALPIVARYGKTHSAMKGPTLTAKSLRALPVPLPPRDQQRQIVNYLDNLSLQINHMDL